MTFGNYVSIVGNMTRDPELRFTPSGAAVVNFGIAHNRKFRDGQGNDVEDVSFFDVQAWSALAENIAESLVKGMRVLVEGRLQQRSWEDKDGNNRTKVEIVADEVSPSLRWAACDVRRNETGGAPAPREEHPQQRRSSNQGGGQRGGGQQRAARAEPSYPVDEEPFLLDAEFGMDGTGYSWARNR
jgi:single-strand DNA-binding protein